MNERPKRPKRIPLSVNKPFYQLLHAMMQKASPDSHSSSLSSTASLKKQEAQAPSDLSGVGVPPSGSITPATGDGPGVKDS